MSDKSKSVKKIIAQNKGSFIIRSRANKNGSIRWYLKFQHGSNSEVTVPKSMYSFFGFRADMSVLQAKTRAKKLNKERSASIGLDPNKNLGHFRCVLRKTN